MQWHQSAMCTVIPYCFITFSADSSWIISTSWPLYRRIPNAYWAYAPSLKRSCSPKTPSCFFIWNELTRSLSRSCSNGLWELFPATWPHRNCLTYGIECLPLIPWKYCQVIKFTLKPRSIRILNNKMFKISVLSGGVSVSQTKHHVGLKQIKCRINTGRSHLA